MYFHKKLFILFYIIIYIVCTTLQARSEKYYLPDIEEYQLDNGMRVLISPNYDHPSVYISVYLNIGRLDDPIDKINVSNLTFYDLDDGTIKFPKEDQIKEELFSLGRRNGRFKYMSIEDSYGYIENYFLKEDTRAGIELFSEILINPTFPMHNEWLISIAVRLVPRKSFLHDSELAEKHIKNQYANKMATIHPKFLFKTSKKDKKDWHKKFIRPENITLMVTGDINYRYIQKLVKEYFGDWETIEPLPERRKYPINITKESGIQLRFVNLENRKDAMIRIMTKGPSFNDSWHSAGQLAMLVFGNGGFSSRLSKIHEKFNQYSYLNYDWQKESRLPYTEIFAEAKYSDLNNLYNEIVDEFKKLANNSISKEELDLSKSVRINYYNNKLHNPEKFSDFIQVYYNNNGYSLENISNKWEEINKVTLDEANDAAAKIYDPNNFMILVMGNRDSCATFLNQFDNVEYYENREELK